MSGLADFLVGDVEAKALRQTDKKKAPSGNYIAIATATKDKFPGVGGTYTNAADQDVVITAANIFENLKDLAFQGGAWLMGHGTVNGKKGKPTEVMEPEIYGLAAEARPTGEVNDKVDFTFKHAFLNIPYLNDLRRNARGKDIFLFTETTVQKIDWQANRPIFKDIGCPVAGSRNSIISGEFSIVWSDKNGELVPYLGVNVDDLSADDIAYTFDEPGTLVNCTKVAGCAGDCATFNRTTSGTCGFTQDVVEAKGCGKHYLFYNDNEAMPAGVVGTVNPITGAISLTTLSSGTHKFTHAFENEVGIFGTYCFKVVVA
jgi:hypothetical protein